MELTNGLQLMEALKQHLAASPRISYVETVVKQVWETDPFPGGFDRYCIVLSPNTPNFHSKSLWILQEIFTLDVACIVKNFDMELSVFGTAAGEIGVLQMVYDVCWTIREFLVTNKNNLEFRFNEIDTVPVTQRSVRDGFYREVCFPVTVHLHKVNIKEKINE